MSKVGLEPAPWRDYKSKKAVLADLQANKDFVVSTYLGGPFGESDGRLVSPQEIIEAGHGVSVRYQRRTKQALFTVKELA